jgi:hypothetical protein
MVEEVGNRMILPHQPQQLLQAAYTLQVQSSLISALGDLGCESLVSTAVQDRTAEAHCLIVDPVHQFKTVLSPLIAILHSP